TSRVPGVTVGCERCATRVRAAPGSETGSTGGACGSRCAEEEATTVTSASAPARETKARVLFMVRGSVRGCARARIGQTPEVLPMTVGRTTDGSAVGERVQLGRRRPLPGSNHRPREQKLRHPGEHQVVRRCDQTEIAHTPPRLRARRATAIFLLQVA